MNKNEFIEKLSQELGSTKVAANKSLDAVLKCITYAMKTNDGLRFVGFGTFKARKIAAKEVKTPKGTMAKVPAHKRISFSVGKEFKQVVNGK
ncbi:HU family DNA-binding protein [Candidatus Bandiella euplotis]|uniref:DNA-binding protein HU n=1 Tax=Candidatus Bandiella euplotis TaxID=1664265 RepID=A0ABZ0UMD6_9RICK|nr:HU family DNA-binding protein [Candidatus Bandiella woodruffii]WPX97328.1 DNA-binding protein HU [Candidatus Bandiella woodruffii]